MTSKNTLSHFSSYPKQFQENSLNTTFCEGQKITCFSYALDTSVTGILIKRLTNSCIVDISTCQTIDERERKTLNNKIVVAYQAITK